MIYKEKVDFNIFTLFLQVVLQESIHTPPKLEKGFKPQSGQRCDYNPKSLFHICYELLVSAYYFKEHLRAPQIFFKEFHFIILI